MSNTTLNFKIEGMHCTSCATNIDWELEDVEGVIDADTSYPKALTKVTYDASVATVDALLAAIKEAGFTAEPVA